MCQVPAVSQGWLVWPRCACLLLRARVATGWVLVSARSSLQARQPRGGRGRPLLTSSHPAMAGLACQPRPQPQLTTTTKINKNHWDSEPAPSTRYCTLRLHPDWLHYVRMTSKHLPRPHSCSAVLIVLRSCFTCTICIIPRVFDQVYIPLLNILLH